MNFPNYTYAPSIVGSYNVNTHKVVPKDAVVLDLSKAPSGLPAETWNPATWVRLTADDAERQTGTWGAPRRKIVRWIADEIEKQTAKPKPAEPDLWGRVTDKKGDTWIRTGPSRTSFAEWMNIDSGHRGHWGDIDVADVWDKGVDW